MRHSVEVNQVLPKPCFGVMWMVQSALQANTISREIYPNSRFWSMLNSQHQGT